MGKYKIIYADPPWSYRVYSKKGMGRNAESHYPTMSMSVAFDAWRQEYTLLLKGQMPQRLESTKAKLDDLYQQQAAAREEMGKPFPYEEELSGRFGGKCVGKLKL